MYYTPRQLAVMDYLRRFIEQHRYAPTLEELSKEFGISRISILQHLQALERKGAIRRTKYMSRAIEILDSGRLTPSVQMENLHFPLKGYIAAGSPIEAVEQEETVSLAEVLGAPRDCYLLRVRGDSMIDDHIQDGDYVIVEARLTAENGETVVALLGTGEATLKRFFREDGRIRLEAANPSVSPIYTNDVRVQGIVVGVVRGY